MVQVTGTCDGAKLSNRILTNVPNSKPFLGMLSQPGAYMHAPSLIPPLSFTLFLHYSAPHAHFGHRNPPICGLHCPIRSLYRLSRSCTLQQPPSCLESTMHDRPRGFHICFEIIHRNVDFISHACALSKSRHRHVPSTSDVTASHIDSDIYLRNLRSSEQHLARQYLRRSCPIA